jgi:hypothetical protein
MPKPRYATLINLRALKARIVRLERAVRRLTAPPSRRCGPYQRRVADSRD